MSGFFSLQECSDLLKEMDPSGPCLALFGRLLLLSLNGVTHDPSYRVSLFLLRNCFYLSHFELFISCFFSVKEHSWLNWCNTWPPALWEVSEFFVVKSFLRGISRAHLKSKFGSVSSHLCVTVSFTSHANPSDNMADNICCPWIHSILLLDLHCNKCKDRFTLLLNFAICISASIQLPIFWGDSSILFGWFFFKKVYNLWK